MSANITDISHFLILGTNTPPPTKIPLGQTSSHLHSQKVSGSRFKSRSKSSKYLPHANYERVYEIINKTKLVVWPGKQQQQFDFDGIYENNNELTFIGRWLLEGRTNTNTNNHKSSYVLIVRTSVESQIQRVLDTIGRQMIDKGMSFQIGAISNKSVTWNQITFASDLKHHLKTMARLNEPIDKICVSCQEFQLIICACSAHLLVACDHILQNLHFGRAVRQTDRYFGVQRSRGNGASYDDQVKHDESYEIAIVSYLPIPCQDNLGKCQSLLQKCVIFENGIRKYAIEQKRQLKQNVVYSNALFTNQNSRASRKTIQQYQTKAQINSKAQNKRRQFSQNDNYYQKSQPSQRQPNAGHQITNNQSNSDASVGQTERASNKKSTDKLLSTANMMAQHMHLKWRIQAMERQFQIQAQQFVIKANKKYADLKQQHSFCLQQNGRLREQNQSLHREIHKIKCEFEATKQLQYRQKESHDRGQATILSLQQSKQKQLHELQQITRINAKLQNELMQKEAQLTKQRKQFQLDIEQKQKQVSKYRSFSEQLRVLHNNLESELNAERNRCLNLEKRCHKYQQTLSQMMQIGVGVHSSENMIQGQHEIYYDEQQYDDRNESNKMKSVEGEQQYKQKRKSNKDKDKDKIKQEHSSTKAEKCQSKRADVFTKKHKREITFATG